MAPLGTLIVAHNTQRETWDNFGTIGYYLGPSYTHYRSYRCLISTTNDIRISDNIILYPAPLVLPGASRFDKLLSLTEELAATVHTDSLSTPTTATDFRECLQKLKSFLQEDSHNAAKPPPVPATSSTRHRPTTDTGIDLIGHTFQDTARGLCRIIGTDTYLDDDGILWHTLQYNSSKYPKDDTRISKVSEVRSWIKRKGSTPPRQPVPKPVVPSTIRLDLPATLRDAPDPKTPFRAILLAPKSVPHVSPYNLRQRRAMTARIRHPTPQPSIAPTTDAYPDKLPPTLNLDQHGRPLTYTSAMAGPNKPHWLTASADEIIKLIDTHTAFPTSHFSIPALKWKDIVYSNPVVKEKFKNNKIQFRVRGTAGGDLLTVPYDISARTANLEVVKILIHSTVSSGRKWMTIDIKDFYLGTPLPDGHYEYIRIHRSKLPAAVITKYNLEPLFYKEHVYFELRKCLYGLPQSGKLSQTRLINHLDLHGYKQCANTPCLFRHVSKDITFSLVVDDFGISYRHSTDVNHLIATLRKLYEITVQTFGETYLGMRITFNAKRTAVTISMPGYIQKTLLRFRPQYLLPTHRAARTPGIYVPPLYGSKLPQMATEDTTNLLSASQKTEIQAIVGTILYYARAVDPSLLPVANEIASQQAAPTQAVLKAASRLLSYCAAHRNGSTTFHACDMCLHGFSDASYLSRSYARSVAGGYLFLGNYNRPTQINGPIHVFSTIIPCIVASAGEAEYAALFAVGQQAASLRTILHDMGYPQQPTILFCDNTTAIGIAMDTIKQKKTKAIDMRFHWIRDRVRQQQFIITYISTHDNIADYFTKNLPFELHITREVPTIHCTTDIIRRSSNGWKQRVC